MRVTAKLNYLHISPRKVRSVVNVVKGMAAKDAVSQLKFIPNRASMPLIKLINSAIANAEHNFSLAAGSLKISEFKVDGGPVFKRFRPGSRGRVSPLKKKTSHITLILDGQREKGSVKKNEMIENISAPESASELNAASRTKDEKRDAVFRSTKSAQVQKKNSGFVKKMFQRKVV